MLLQKLFCISICAPRAHTQLKEKERGYCIELAISCKTVHFWIKEGRINSGSQNTYNDYSSVKVKQ